MRVWIVIVLAALAGAGLWWHASRQDLVEPSDKAAEPRPRDPVFHKVVFPTDRQDLLDEARSGVFQPTASGSVESALYGSVRTVKSGKGLASSFHEGVDIAPLSRDRRGLPLDKVYAVAEGTVAHVNRVAGNSNYGLYVVLLHDDPMGRVYTLYAHLADIEPGVSPGAPVAAGTVLGRMGHTPAGIIPVSRSHLHFEVGLLMNASFGHWFRSQRMKPDHGMFNGMNLLALDPLAFFRAQRERRGFVFRDFMEQVPVAFEILVKVDHPLDYFRRYPALWTGGEPGGGWMVLSCSGNGTPLQGRAATGEEIRRAGERKAVVLRADAGVLGRNGCHLVQREGGGWRMGAKGQRWLEILSYP